MTPEELIMLLGQGGLMSQGIQPIPEPQMEPASLAETMDPAMGMGDPQQNDIYAQLFKLFAPQFTSPDEEFQKRNRQDAMLAAGAGMLSGEDLMAGMGRAGGAFQQVRREGRETEQRRLDLRAREEALNQARQMTAMARMQSAGRETQPKTPTSYQNREQTLEEHLARLEASENPEDWALHSRISSVPPELGWEMLQEHLMPEPSDLKSPERIAQDLEIFEAEERIRARFAPDTLRNVPGEGVVNINRNNPQGGAEVVPGTEPGPPPPRITGETVYEDLISDPKNMQSSSVMFALPALGLDEDASWNASEDIMDDESGRTALWYINRWYEQETGKPLSQISPVESMRAFAMYIASTPQAQGVMGVDDSTLALELPQQ
jgi:hypothetical protein